MSILTEFTVFRFTRQLSLLLLLAGFASFAGAASSEPAAADDRWAMLRAQLFADAGYCRRHGHCAHRGPWQGIRLGAGAGHRASTGGHWQTVYTFVNCISL